MKSLALLLIPYTLSACSAATESPDNVGSGELTLMERGISAQIASVSLASDCGSAAGGVSADCSETCPSLCQQSTVQLSLSSHGPSEPVAIRLLPGARLLKAADDSFVGIVIPRNPLAWNMTSYQTWDEHLAPETDLAATYDLGAEDWNALSLEYGVSYVLELELEIDGSSVTVRSSEVSLAPQIAT